MLAGAVARTEGHSRVNKSPGANVAAGCDMTAPSSGQLSVD